METVYIYAAIGFAGGCLLTWIIMFISVKSLKKANKSLQGFLESEKLKKDVLVKENKGLYQSKENLLEEYALRIEELATQNRRMDEDILLLQKSNEETEKLLQAGMPVLHTLKLQLIEANNTIARYKGQLDKKAVENI